MKINICYLNPALPELFSKDGDSGYDLRASLEIPLTIPPRGIATIPCGVAVEITDLPQQDSLSVEIQIRPRSGLTKKGIVAQFGTVDSSYRGELKVNIFNFNDHELVLQPLDRIAQMVVCPIYKPQVCKVDALSETERGAKGFGSSGIQ